MPFNSSDIYFCIKSLIAVVSFVIAVLLENKINAPYLLLNIKKGLKSFSEFKHSEPSTFFALGSWFVN